MLESLSLFFPTYNEEGNIAQAVASAKKVLDKVASKWEIIVVNDGSKDRTKEIAERLSSEDKRIRVVSHKENRGYGAALKTGFENAKYPWVAFIDSDGQFDFSEIEKFIAKKDQADLILGFRKKRADSIARKIFTFGWATLARIILGLKAKDYSCGFKMIKKKVYEEVQPLIGEEKVTQIELLVKARKKNFRFAEVGVNHYPRVSGKPTGAKLSVVFKSVVDLFKLWGKMNDVPMSELLILLVILTIGAFLRLYKIDQYMTFLGDEGRDAIIVRRIFTELHPPLIGPGTSVGNMYLGPLYYYMMAPALLIANFSPVGPAVMIALLGVITTAFIWLVGKEWFGRTAGLVAAGLYAIAPAIIIYSRSSWNPNIMPFFALLSVYSVWKIWKYKKFGWLIILGISYAFVLQSHYLGLLLIPTILIFLALTFKDLGSKKIFLQKALFGFLIFAGLMSPLLIFDARHGWRNLEAMKNFVVNRERSEVTFNIATAVRNSWGIYEKVNTRLVTATNPQAGLILSLLLIPGIIWIARKNFLLIAWLGFGILGLGFYQKEIFDHYMGFLFPAPFLLMGGIASQLLNSKSKLSNTLKVVLAIVLGSLIFVNLVNSPVRNAPNTQLQRAISVAKVIQEKAMGQRFNLATISNLNNRDVYQYFLMLWGAKIVDTDPSATSFTVTDQLFVVCELPKEVCDPIHDPSAWITNFGWTKIVDQWPVWGGTLFKLAHAK